MFKKLITVGALAVGILFGGIGTAFAYTCPSDAVRQDGSLYKRNVVNPYNNFANVFTQPYYGKTITWYFKGPSEACLYNGNLAYTAYYEGRIN
ncbi:hypothetical protein PSI19_18300 [Xenorhabdus khoisanae]|uniref:Antimicrobial protein n=1 Tax=Xenorhabdus khoisanae TaxID=880157 RepID=A0A0J5IRG7_9GAMM|nr:hypothetical protein [Xenorhabdus khoisanae]KMJ45800.1 hypothetical protein AB204_07280 [Xenorhabdus khoisanae]MDC9615786.1 hypothetical protein [Xenorhabdus khoisanae]